MWYMVSAHRASQIQGLINRMMTTEQVEEAQQRAEAWLSRLKGSPINLLGSQTFPATEDDSWKRPGRPGSEKHSATGK